MGISDRHSILQAVQRLSGPSKCRLPSILVRNYVDEADLSAEILWRVAELIESESVNT